VSDQARIWAEAPSLLTMRDPAPAGAPSSSGAASAGGGGGGGGGKRVASVPASGPVHANPFPRVNWEDPHINVATPVFTIHGNHDDPAREGDEVGPWARGGGGGGGGWGAAFADRISTQPLLAPLARVWLQVLAALDIVSVAGLVNYFGRVDVAATITLSPLCITKGDTKLALYGVGHIRDDRFQRLLLSNSIRFQRPALDPASWFSTFLIHQNR
jgi:double-strand break repair protein MRE11